MTEQAHAGKLLERALADARWARAIEAAERGHPERLAWLLRGDSAIPDALRRLLAERAHLIVPKSSSGRPSVLDPELLSMEREGYARQPRGRKKAFVIDAAQVHGVDPAVMKKMLTAVADPKK